jgi:hypothetical protein
MDTADWIMLILALMYILYKSKNIYYAFIGSFVNNGTGFTLYLIGFVVIFITFCIVGVVSPMYRWIPQWTFIWYIVAFFVCRFLFGIPK